MDTLLFALNAVLPLVLLIALGYVLKRIKFLTPEFLKIGNKLIFRVALPVMLFMNIYNVESLANIEIEPALFAMGGILGAFIIGFILVKLSTKEIRQKGVVHQGVFRSNYAILGIPLATMLCGEPAKTMASFISAFTIPLFNILAVVALTMYDNEGLDRKASIKKTLKGIAKNPLIWGVMLGVLVVAIRELFVKWGIDFRIKDIEFLYKSATNLSSLTTPLALIILGGQFEFKSIKGFKTQLIVTTVTRTVIVPAVCLTVACLLGFRGAAIASFVAVFGSPVAVSSSVMATEMNGDGELAASIVVATTVVSAITLVVLISVLQTLGMF